jgi:ABC-2 type transport system ATP-binding protein
VISGGSAIDLRRVSKRFGPTTAVNGVDLVVPYGSSFGLLGPNGAGKTTLIKMLIGLLPIDSGQAIVLGHDVTLDRPRIARATGYVPELPNIYPWMTVSEVIWFVKNLYSTWDEDLYNKMLKMFELPLNKRIKHLSRGTVAKLCLLLALAPRPRLLILDEPLTGLDPLVREEFLDGVLVLTRRQDITIFFSSHTVGDVEKLADVVGILYRGQLLFQRSMETLRGAKRVRAVLRDGATPQWRPEAIISDRQHGREWLLTVPNCSPDVLTRLNSENSLTILEVVNCTLEDLFKDYIKGVRENEGTSLEGPSVV